MTKAKPKKTGRPSLYTEALAAKICRRLAGSSILPRWAHHGPTMAVQRPSRLGPAKNAGSFKRLFHPAFPQPVHFQQLMRTMKRSAAGAFSASAAISMMSSA